MSALTPIDIANVLDIDIDNVYAIQQQAKARMNCHCILVGSICEEHIFDWSLIDQPNEKKARKKRLRFFLERA